MSKLTLKQITDKLNEAFNTDTRQLVFWYDESGRFEEEIDSLELKNAKVYRLKENNQLYTKYFLECEDTTTNYLVYAPFPKPDTEHNHLEDMCLYSKIFHANMSTLICAELGISEELKPVLDKYDKFFSNKQRVDKFCSLEIENWSENKIEIGIMSALCNTKTASFEEVLKVMLSDDLENNKYLEEFSKYDLLDAFWEKAEFCFGYSEQNPNLKQFVAELFLTYASTDITEELPKRYKDHVAYKTGSVVTFLDNLMNNNEFSERFDYLSDYVYKGLNGDDIFKTFSTEAIYRCVAFKNIDKFIIKWLIERLESEDTSAKLSDDAILQICAYRKQTHFGKQFATEYSVIECAYHIIFSGKYESVSILEDVVRNYIEKYYKNDRYYRLFYFNYDKLEDTTDFENLKELIENIYTNEYLQPICKNYAETFIEENGNTNLPKQINFWVEKVKPIKERVVVIISDAMRYDVGQSLYEKLNADEKCKVNISAMQTVLPSITMFGMAALLPHKNYEFTQDNKIKIDGKNCASSIEREKILQTYNPNSLCIQYDDIKEKKTRDLKKIVEGKEVIYVYHNQIDARGDKAITENEVFNACNEAIDEIASIIKKLTTANVTHFLVTSDHGFVYKRNKLETGNKIDDIISKSSFCGKRYAISDSELNTDGTGSICIGQTNSTDDKRIVNFPLGSDIFKAQGAGINYVHGGCSPQEMIIPLIDVKTDKSRVETTFAEIALMTNINRITNLNINLEFFQRYPVSDIIKPAEYHIYFETESGERISNENIFFANSTEENAIETKCKFRFSFKNRVYNNSEKYYMVIYDEEHNITLSRTNFIIDIAFADDFGF